jgi:hypothetical protein
VAGPSTAGFVSNATFAELVALDLADEGAARAEICHADDRIGCGPSGNLHRRPHRLVDRRRSRLVDQRHAALGHALLGQKAVVGACQDVNNGVADAEDVVSRRCHLR